MPPGPSSTHAQRQRSVSRRREKRGRKCAQYTGQTDIETGRASFLPTLDPSTGGAVRSHSSEEGHSSMAKRNARPVMFHLFSRSREIICTRRTRSGSTRSKLTVSLPICIAPRRWRAYGHIRKAVFIMMGGSPRCLMWFSTTTRSSKLNLSDEQKKDLIEYLKGI